MTKVDLKSWLHHSLGYLLVFNCSKAEIIEITSSFLLTVGAMVDPGDYK